MNWRTLFSSHRLGVDRTRVLPKSSEGRSEFQRDFDRVIFSSSFRRLQSKTQVVPLPGNDFVHTRLTHSLEASCVGRSLGRIVGDRIIKSDPLTFKEIGVTSSDFESVIAAACLAHDIGNPPFGHSGEDAISEYFKSDKAKPFLDGLNKKQIADLQHFEGNAAGFRLLTHTSPTQSQQNIGLGLTFATLGTFMKYPKESLPEIKNSENASENKFGFFQTEKSVFANIATQLKLIPKPRNMWHRHPLVFLVEAADDICYAIIDLEDGYKLDMVSFETAERLLVNVIGADFSGAGKTYRKILDTREKIGFLRAKAINKLVWEAADIFTEKLPDIMNGKFDRHISDLIPSHSSLTEIVDVSVQKIYRAQPILEIEAAGFEVLAGLLDTFLTAIFDDSSKRSQMIKRLIPDQYLDAKRQRFPDKYQNILNITEMVAGMTDTYAIDTFRKLKGISLPTY